MSHQETLQDLFIDQLKDLYNAEKQLVKALPKMAKAASSGELQSAFKNHLEETKEHVERLEEIFESIGASPKGKTCKAMAGLVAEGAEQIQQNASDSVMDAGLIAAAVRIEHYEMAGYGTVRTYAELLGNREAAKLLQQTLDEEGNANKELTDLALNEINAAAMPA